MESRSTAPASGPRAESSLPPRPPGIRGFLRGPRLADRRGFAFLVTIFILVVAVFAVAFYGFITTLQPLPSAPIRFGRAYMVGGNGTFNVTSDSNTSWSWTGFSINLTINNFGGMAAPLAPSGQNASLLIGSTVHKDPYHVIWVDRDHDGRVSVGDVFWVTGDGVGLPALSYCKFSLTWDATGWTAAEYWVTSNAIV
jgi:hypothetical protein